METKDDFWQVYDKQTGLWQLHRYGSPAAIQHYCRQALVLLRRLSPGAQQLLAKVG
jgi:hypothetical protein